MYRLLSGPALQSRVRSRALTSFLPYFAPAAAAGFHARFAAFGKIVPFKLADIGEGIREVEVLKWYVNEGDHVTQFQQLCEVQSDKATVEITSRFDGVIKKIHYPLNSMAIVGTPLVDLEVPDNGADDAKPVAVKEAPKVVPAPAAPVAPVAPAAPAAAPLAAPQPASQATSADESISDRLTAAPAVRRLVKEFSLNPRDLAGKGTGKDGRLLKEDVIAFMENRSNVAAAPAAVAAAPEPVSAPAPTAASTSAANPFVSYGIDPANFVVGPNDRVEPIRGLRRAMVKTMNLSLAVPHFGLEEEVEMDNLKALRETLRGDFLKKNIKLSYMPFMIKAASLALQTFPDLNASFNPEKGELIYRSEHNIGVAMDTPAGLIVPCVKSAQRLSVFEIAVELNRLQALGSEGKLGAKELEGTTFSISNIGAIGGTVGHPVINPPQVAIGALGRIQRLPRFDENDAVVAKHIMRVCWSGDHRVLDGATVTNFSNTWKKLLENPTLMLTGFRFD